MDIRKGLKLVVVSGILVFAVTSLAFYAINKSNAISVTIGNPFYK